MEHRIETDLGLERLDVSIDGTSHTLLCRYITNKGDVHSVYTSDKTSNVVIEQNNDSAIIGFFSVEDSNLCDLLDYIQATFSKKHGFDYCLTGKMQNYLQQATALGGNYKFLSSQIMPEQRSILSRIVSNMQRQPALTTSLALKVLKHLVRVEHLEHSPAQLDAISDRNEGRSTIEITPYSSLQPPCFTPAKSLPEGWYWREYQDGSGALQAPDGHLHFFHDGISVTSGHFEYLEKAESPWSSFSGSFGDFKAYAESMINTKYLNRKEGLETTIKNADDRKPARAFGMDARLKNNEIEL